MPKLTEPLVLSRSRAPSLDAVKKLNCWASKIDDISMIHKLPNVEVVNLSCNNIKTLEPFRHCQQLRELYVRRNSIQTLGELQYLQDLSTLRNLWLADNPCAECDHYRATVLKALPGLDKLDNVAVTEEERSGAVELGLELDSPAKFDTPDQSPTQNGEPEITDPAELSCEETNRIRRELGLKPVSSDKVTPAKPNWREQSRGSNTLQAVMLLLNELNEEELTMVGNAVRDKLNLDEPEPEPGPDPEPGIEDLAEPLEEEC